MRVRAALATFLSSCHPPFLLLFLHGPVPDQTTPTPSKTQDMALKQKIRNTTDQASSCFSHKDDVLVRLHRPAHLHLAELALRDPLGEEPWLLGFGAL